MENTIFLVEATDVEKATFYRKTYMHVAFAVLAFIGLEAFIFTTFADQLPGLFTLMLGNNYSWLIVLGLFWLGSSLSNGLAHSPSKTLQYVGLGFYVVLEAIIFLPLIYMAWYNSGPEMLSQAAGLTLFLFGGLTAVVFLTNTNFSFLKSALVIGSFIAIGLIVLGSIFGFDLGLWFSLAMVVLAAIAILYQTSKLKYEYTSEQYVGAALGVFASLMLLFWYILRIFMSRR